MGVPSVVAELVERFEAHKDAYRSPQYNEAQLRGEFLNPLFEALGWDVFNRKGYAAPYKEVIHEDAIKVGGRTKAPDYCFRAGGGMRSFFVEAKKPSVDISEAASPAYQLRRYAWSAKLPVSILTDFQELAVYDCRIRPERTDRATTARIILRRYTEYVECWDDLAALFSPEAIRRGSLERLVASKKIKKGTAEVDRAFLDEIESWRMDLARNIALRNPDLSQRDLNYAVQRTIDRIIFLRICEDRGIEPYGTLESLQNAPGIYRRLGELFQRADDRYNSGLFHFTAEKDRPEPPDELTLGLQVDDKPLKDILQKLYFPESPYEFSVFPAEILGQVYEQFLGKVIRLTKGHQAKVEEKPEVRKAGGVYYTPAYIVDYIVRHTVGKLLDRRTTFQVVPQDAASQEARTTLKVALQDVITPARAAKLRILDPACGSGSFLIRAYQYLLDWHRDWYTADGAEKHAKGRNPKLYCGRAGDWRLTPAEKKRILLNSIYGVDIDRQAVEVTKLSLLLKVLEGESKETVNNQLRLLHERALPDLAANIKCGNSLIGPDFYNGRQMSLLDEEEIYRINAMDWHAEFPEVFKAGGFDAVIANPPYVRQESLSAFKEYFASHYEAFDSVADLYAYFMEKGIRLLRDGGLFSVIVSSSFLRATYGASLRRTLKKHAAVVRIVDFGGLSVFTNAKDTYVCIPLLAKSGAQNRVEVSKIESLDVADLSDHVAANHFTIPHERLSADAWSLKSDAEAEVFAKVMKAGKPLGEYVAGKMFYGLKTGFNEAFEVTGVQRAALTSGSRATKALIHRFLGGQDIRRYFTEDKKRYLIVIPAGWTREQLLAVKNRTAAFSEKEAWAWFSEHYPTVAGHLAVFKDALRKRQDQGDYWWELRACDYYQYLDGPKIAFPDICKGPRFCLDPTGMYLANTAYCLGTGDLYLLGVLNSRLFWFAIANISIPFGIRAGQYRYRLIYQYMEKVPIRVVDPSDAADRARHDRMVDLVEAMLALHKKLSAARTGDDKMALHRQIDATNRQIDRLVYDLYGLSDAEIAVVEEASA